MQLQFKATNYDITDDVQAYAEKKLSALEKFDKSNSAKVYVELGRETGAHAHGRVWRAEINFDMEGARLRAEATEESLEAALDSAIGELSQGLRTHKSKQETLGKRGGRMLKSMLRGFKS
jgi:ribosomal subunit interface protein